MHRTLKHALGKEPAADKAALQMQLDAFVEHYNQQRPHEALQQSMPAQHYSDSTRPYPQSYPSCSTRSIGKGFGSATTA